MKTITNKLYEAMFLVDSVLAASDWNGVNKTIETILERADGQIVSMRKWDERRLAYDINKKSRGTYILCYFRTDGSKIPGIERDVQLSERIMRVLVLNAEHMTDESIEKEIAIISAEKQAKQPAQPEAAPEQVEAEQPAQPKAAPEQVETEQPAQPKAAPEPVEAEQPAQPEAAPEPVEAEQPAQPEAPSEPVEAEQVIESEKVETTEQITESLTEGDEKLEKPQELEETQESEDSQAQSLEEKEQ